MFIFKIKLMLMPFQSRVKYRINYIAKIKIMTKTKLTLYLNLFTQKQF